LGTFVFLGRKNSARVGAPGCRRGRRRKTQTPLPPARRLLVGSSRNRLSCKRQSDRVLCSASAPPALRETMWSAKHGRAAAARNGADAPVALERLAAQLPPLGREVIGVSLFRRQADYCGPRERKPRRKHPNHRVRAQAIGSVRDLERFPIKARRRRHCEAKPKQSRAAATLDCFVASLLAMTVQPDRIPL
jgi:hypothetical protein